jgi:branched-chain amino acid transport system substrate-binding protein
MKKMYVSIAHFSRIDEIHGYWLRYLLVEEGVRTVTWFFRDVSGFSGISWFRVLALLLSIALMLAFLAACGAGTGTQSGVIIEIGSDFPTSQADAAAGKPVENGIRYAIDQANNAHFLSGYTFVLNAKDDVGPNGTHDPNVGANNISLLVGDARVAAIVGPSNSSVAQAEMPIANKAGIALLSPANTNDCLTQETPADECGGANSLIAKLRPTGNVTYFRTATPDQYQGKALAQFAAKEKGYKTAYVIDDTETYGAGLAKNFIKSFQGYGGRVIDHKSIQSTLSYENVLTAVAAAKPDFLFFGGVASTGATTIRQQMATVPGLQNLPFLGGDGTKNPELAKAIAPLKGGPIYNTIPGTDPSTVPASKDFYTNFQKVYGQIGAYSAAAYDDANIVINAIKAVITNKKILPAQNPNDAATAKIFRQNVIDAMQKTDYAGLTGHHTFDKNGDTTNRSISLYTLGDPNVGDGWKYLKAITVSGEP